MGDEDESKQVVTKQSNTVITSPYTLFSSDNPGALITSVQLKGDNYNERAMKMMNALRAKKKTVSLTKPCQNLPKAVQIWSLG